MSFLNFFVVLVAAHAVVGLEKVEKLVACTTDAQCYGIGYCHYLINLNSGICKPLETKRNGEEALAQTTTELPFDYSRYCRTLEDCVVGDCILNKCEPGLNEKPYADYWESRIYVQHRLNVDTLANNGKIEVAKLEQQLRCKIDKDCPKRPNTPEMADDYCYNPYNQLHGYCIPFWHVKA